MRRLSLVAALVAIAGVGCGDSTEATPDGGPDIVFDASPRPDVPETPDAGPGPGSIGEACREDGDCSTNELCVDFPGGYCTADCGSLDCPSGSSCVQVDRATFLCLADCDPAAADPCRAGYGCTTDPSLGNVCIPGCTTNDDCADGLECDAEGGAAGEGACFDPDSEVGDACTTDEECPSGNFCFQERFGGWPAGACVEFGCDPVGGTGCGEGAVCVAAGGGDGLCIAACTGASDCRDGYDCVEGGCRPGCDDSDECSDGRVCNPAVGTCASPFDATLLGDTCSGSRRACLGGTCLSEFASGFPGSYCSYLGCDPAATDATDGCPGDGVCKMVDGEALCLDACTVEAGCREGYACRQVDPENAERGLACVPACTSDDACANDGTDGAPDFSCNPGTGLCTDPFLPARLGFMCLSGEDCPGGRCLDEASSGWPAGSCVAVGCRLSGEGPEQPCPEGGVCVDDGMAPADIGMCLDACAVAMSGACRAGYACTPLTEGSGDGACRPACTEESCSEGRVCTDGLCVAAP
ncbi:MAG: hypothetical protein H6720_03725 [Sandaracinus sp.]|nr:hypothetical protein [Sandaracinus sp.]